MFKKFLNTSIKIIKKVDKTNEVAKSLKFIERNDVLVGIPEQQSSRAGQPINNAELGYILSHGVRHWTMINEMDTSMQKGKNYKQALDAYLMAHGDPLWHIPPRPILEPPIEANIDKIVAQQTKVLRLALDAKQEQAKREMAKTGMLGQSLVKAWFVDPRNNWPENAPSTIERKGSDRPNIDKGALRNSITYVMRDKNAHD